MPIGVQQTKFSRTPRLIGHTQDDIHVVPERCGMKQVQVGCGSNPQTDPTSTCLVRRGIHEHGARATSRTLSVQAQKNLNLTASNPSKICFPIIIAIRHVLDDS